VDALYRHKHGLTVTANYSLQDLVSRERMHPAIVRRLINYFCSIAIPLVRSSGSLSLHISNNSALAGTEELN
jgi:hypothetical protein